MSFLPSATEHCALLINFSRIPIAKNVHFCTQLLKNPLVDPMKLAAWLIYELFSRRVFNHQDFIASFAVDQLVHHALSQQNAESARAHARLSTLLVEMSGTRGLGNRSCDRVFCRCASSDGSGFGRGGVRAA